MKLFFIVIWSDAGHNRDSILFDTRGGAGEFRATLQNHAARILRVYL